jgi:hypothetical protein
MPKWLEKLKEKGGKKGLIPWLSVKVQKWILITLVCLTLPAMYMSVGYSVILVVLDLAIGASALYVGVKTNWLKNIDRASKTVKYIGAADVCIGVLNALIIIVYFVITLAIMAFFLLLFIGFIVLMFKIFLGSGEKSDKQATTIIRQTRTIREKTFEQGSNLEDASGRKIGDIQKAYFSNDQIIRNSDGNQVGAIRQNLFDNNVQDIFDEDDKKVGEIRNSILGEREIVDGSGNRIGVIGKNIWGETNIDQ